MNQAQITVWGEPPKYTAVPELPAPAQDEIRIKVEASGAHRVVRSRASGRHYSSEGLPHVPGIDGVGRTEEGRPVYFTSFSVGAMSEFVNMPKSAVFDLPHGADPFQIAGSVNPAMSSWMALKSRTTNLPSDFTCLILGVTSASGRVAISIARTLGAKMIVGAARNQTAMDSLGLDKTILLESDPEKTNFGNLADVDVVLDYVYGATTLNLLKSLRTRKPVQYVHIGAVSGEQALAIPGDILRGKDITIRGAGPGSWRMADFIATLPELLNAMTSLPEQQIRVAALKDIEQEWKREDGSRLVFKM